MSIQIGYYKHYKGGIYQVIGTAIHTETNEVMVIYYDAKMQLFTRPLHVWNSPTDDGKIRFKHYTNKRDGYVDFALMRNHYRKNK